MPEELPPRQAIVLVHGIGNQRPMATLRRFVEELLAGCDRDGPRYYSKPDRFETTRELRRLAVPCLGGKWGSDCEPFGVDTDFYEFYWAYLIRDTTWRHLVGWFKALMLRIPLAMGPVYTVLWLVAWSSVAATGWLALRADGLDAFASAPPWVSLGLLAAVGGVGLSVVGDAARYLSNSPANVVVRRDIRNAGLDLIGALNGEGSARYARIVVVGHSLGSIVAYDVLSHLWQRQHVPEGVKEAVGAVDPDRDLMARLDAARAAARTVEDWQAAQTRLLAIARELQVEWRITDLVTAGSPLHHARWLLASTQQPLADLVQQRELPSCPPQSADERDGRLVRRPVDTSDRRLIRVLHHGAMFGCMRWTNLHAGWRDPIGGRLPPAIGELAKEVRIVPGSWRRWVPFSAHSRYWRERQGREALRAVLRWPPAA